MEDEFKVSFKDCKFVNCSEALSVLGDMMYEHLPHDGEHWKSFEKIRNDIDRLEE